MSMLPKRFITPEQYLEMERRAEFRSEYYNGETFALAGAKRPHNLIKMNIGGQLYQQLRSRPCEASTSDQRVWIAATGLYTYPDLVVVCGEPHYQDSELDTLLNPTLLVEVLSPSTEAYDRGRKFGHYRSIETLQAYLMVASEAIGVELFTRQTGGVWSLVQEGRRIEDTIELEAIGCRLALADIYERIELS